MSKEYDKNEKYRNEYSREIGEVKIADDVVAAIAALAASEVEGVAAISGSMTKEIVTKRGMKNLSRGMSISEIAEVLDETEERIREIASEDLGGQAE